MSLDHTKPSKGLNDSRSRQPSKRIIEASHDKSRHSCASYTTCEEDMFLDTDEPCIIEEATVMNAKEVTIEAPTLPQKSSLRASKLLDSLQLNSIESATQTLTDPHDVYLSSEEDASSSADDFSDYDYDSDSEKSEKSPLRRRSQEDTARAVSVIYIGKPFVVDLASGRRSTSPIRRPRPIYEGSSSSIDTNSLASRQSQPSHRQSSSASSLDMSRRNPSFLDQDPFATGNYKLDSASSSIAAVCHSPRIPKSPTGALHRFSKSLSLARRRSRPNLKDTFSRDSVVSMPASTSTSNLLTLDTSQVPEKHSQRPELVSAASMPSQLPATSTEIVRSTRKTSISHRLSSQSMSQPMTPTSPTTSKRGILSGLNMKRRQSMRIKP
ncbi:hypothetical protein F5B20DRAFT_339232 [Whalleya microplaca]|nr:hypothetical protein F5B20DRAFT_339232 [Whalleya microplaca]